MAGIPGTLLGGADQPTTAQLNPGLAVFIVGASGAKSGEREAEVIAESMVVTGSVVNDPARLIDATVNLYAPAGRPVTI